MSVRDRMIMYSLRQDQINNTRRHRRLSRVTNDYFLYNDVINNITPSPRRNALGNTYEDLPEHYSASDLEPVVVPITMNKLLENSKLEVYSENTEYKYKEDKCFICLDKLKTCDIIRLLKCNHKFCQLCIDKWFLSNHKCPVCKYDLHDENIKYDTTPEPIEWGDSDIIEPSNDALMTELNNILMDTFSDLLSNY